MKIETDAINYSALFYFFSILVYVMKYSCSFAVFSTHFCR